MEFTKPLFMARLLIQADRPDIAHGVITNASTVVPSWGLTAADVRRKLSTSQLEALTRWYKTATVSDHASAKVLGLMVLEDISDPSRHPLDTMSDLPSVIEQTGDA